MKINRRSDGSIYAIEIGGDFYDFRRWWVVWIDGEKSDDWVCECGLCRKYIEKLRKQHTVRLEPIPRFKTIFHGVNKDRLKAIAASFAVGVMVGMVT